MRESNPITSTILPYNGFMFSFEKDADSVYMLNTWKQYRHYGFYFVAAYLTIIFSLQHYMKDRKPYRLSIPLALWNFTLGIYSILSSWRGLLDFYNISAIYGVHYFMCSRFRYQFLDIWLLLFQLSKFVELGDTIFVVLRKRPLQFLHWYHHALVVVLISFASDENFAAGKFFMTTNTTVHSFMYIYYGLKALKVHVPKLVSMSITSLQITQMVLAVLVIIYSYISKMSGYSCITPYKVLNAFVLAYVSFAALFIKFFYKSYITSSVRSHAKTN